MLEALNIRDYALIDELEVELGPGFNVLTGETGAGKSIIVGALGLVLGARASSDAVRTGAKEARIQAAFRISRPSRRLASLLRQHDVALEDGQLVLSRVITAEGRSRGAVSGALVPVGTLREIGDELVDIHGQHEHQSLLKSDRQLDLLDAFAAVEQEVSDLQEVVRDLRNIEKQIEALEADDRERARRAEFLRFELTEIRAAGLHASEEEELRSRHKIIANAEKLFELANLANMALYEGEERSAIDAIDGALDNLDELAAIDERFKPTAEQLRAARESVADVASELRRYGDELEFDPAELDVLNERLALIGSLKRKYGDSIPAILEYAENAARELDVFDGRDQNLAELREKRSALLNGAQEVAAGLSKTRRAAAKKLDKQVTAALADLGMRGGRFETRIEAVDLGPNGIDSVTFLLAANPGEELKPLRLVASGGEISRIMLALKAVFAEGDKIPTLIFDEIDAGVGGHIARKVAAKLRDLAESHQVVCITHIAQIAAAAQSHHTVAKHEREARTTTAVVRVKGKARVEEMARLLDGSISEVSLKHARQLLKSGGQD